MNRTSRVKTFPRRDVKNSATQISTARMLLYSALASCLVFVVGISLQWFVYADWLHETGPLHLIGSGMAMVITFLFVTHWQRVERRRHAEAIRRFELIAEMNDRLRNQLQAIECLMYMQGSGRMRELSLAVERIDEILREVVDRAAPRVTALAESGEDAEESPVVSGQCR